MPTDWPDLNISAIEGLFPVYSRLWQADTESQPAHDFSGIFHMAVVLYPGIPTPGIQEAATLENKVKNRTPWFDWLFIHCQGTGLLEFVMWGIPSVHASLEMHAAQYSRSFWLSRWLCDKTIRAKGNT